MKKVSEIIKIAKRHAIPITSDEAEAGKFFGTDGKPIDSKELLIQLMLPPAVKAFYAELEQEVTELCGTRFAHDQGDASRWGSQGGSIFMANQKVAVEKPRVRSGTKGEEIPLKVYEKFQNPHLFDETVFTDAMKHVSQRDYAKGLPKLAASFGISKSAVSRRWINATSKKLSELHARDIAKMNIVAIFIDGKRFRGHGIVIALGVGLDGKKHVLGIYQANTETGDAVMNLLNELEHRGLPTSNLIFIVDGGSGLNRALNEKYSCHSAEKRKAIRVRCWFHKWQNIQKCLGKDEKLIKDAAALYWAIRKASSLAEASAAARSFKSFMRPHNPSVVATFEEAEKDLLAIFELGTTAGLRQFLSTTNSIESLNYLLEEDLRRVKRWIDSTHFQRWLATACMHNEKRMHRIQNAHALPALAINVGSICCAFSFDKEQALVG